MMCLNTGEITKGMPQKYLLLKVASVAHCIEVANNVILATSTTLEETGLIRKSTENHSLVGRSGHYVCLPTAAIYNHTKHTKYLICYIWYINIINTNS
jgi:hypothetical protein